MTDRKAIATNQVKSSSMGIVGTATSGLVPINTNIGAATRKK